MKKPVPEGLKRWKRHLFGFTEEQVSDFGMTWGLGAFMLYMLFIIGELA